METLKSKIPNELKKTIQESTPNDVTSTCTQLHHFFSQSTLFHSVHRLTLLTLTLAPFINYRPVSSVYMTSISFLMYGYVNNMMLWNLQMIEDLTNTQLGYFVKSKETALELKSNGNASFSAMDYSQALHFYSQALRVAPVDAVDKDNKLVAVLYVNRASALHKLNLLEESVRDCDRALSISPDYAKAWYRRGKVKTSLLNYKESITDLKVAIKMEGTSSGKRQIENDLKLIANQHRTGSSMGISAAKLPLNVEVPQSNIQCVTTPTKGRGMASVSDIPAASLIHREEPYAAIMLKKFRETHCHFCFNELPADSVPCSMCSMPLYCSGDCQLQAGGQKSRKLITSQKTDELLSDELQKCFSEVTLESHSSSEAEFTEHGHECHGVNWPTVLPSEVVLAGRIFVKLLESKEHSYDAKKLDLSHNYGQLFPESKVELHVYSIVLLYCLHQSYGPKVELNGANVAKIVVLISQVKVNSMAIVRMNNQDKYQRLDQQNNLSPGDAVTSHLEQVRVGQAIYVSGSLFNHSCMPNVHAYFISRTLFIRATEFVLAGRPLELSYGPEVGQSSYRQRQLFLQDNYSFKCECDGCTTVNFPDLVLEGFHCANSMCSGVVLDHSTAEFERHKNHHLQEISEAEILMLKNQGFADLFLKVVNNVDIKDVASLMFEQSDQSFEIRSGCCLKCGSANDLKSLHAKVDEAEVSIQSLQGDVPSSTVHADCLSDALCHFEVLKTRLHPYNKKLAQAHDILAEAFCSVAQTQLALNHCLASVEILKKIYRHGHITVGNELLKLASLQLLVDDDSAADTVTQMDTIFSNYYGNHAHEMFPYLKHLKVQAQGLPNGRKADV